MFRIRDSILRSSFGRVFVLALLFLVVACGGSTPKAKPSRLGESEASLPAANRIEESLLDHLPESISIAGNLMHWKNEVASIATDTEIDRREALLDDLVLYLVHHPDIVRVTILSPDKSMQALSKDVARELRSRGVRLEIAREEIERKDDRCNAKCRAEHAGSVIFYVRYAE